MGIYEEAWKYFRLGVPIVPVKLFMENGKWVKKPLVSWGKWVDEKQTEEEFKQLPFDNANGFAIVCGHETPQGHICAVDIDMPWREAINKLRSWPGFVITRLEKTISGRLHLIYYSRAPVPSFRREGLSLELKGRGSLCIMAPSHGYERVNDNPPAVLEDAYSYFLELCRAFGHDVEPRFDAAEDNAKLEKWLEMIISSKKIEITGRGPNYYYARCPFHPPDRNPSFAIHRRKYYAVDYHDGCVFSLKELARELGIRLEDEHREEHQEKKSKRCLLGGEILGGCYLVEVVEADGAPKLLVYDLEAGGLGIHEAFEHDGVAYQPYPDLPFKLPGAPERIDVDPTLWRDTLEFIREYYDNPRGEEVYHVMTAGVAWSYFYRDVKASTPFLLFLGPWRSGKTRALEVMAALCHRAMAIVDPSEASVFRLIEELRPTLIIDEAQIMDKNVRAIMAAAYRYGMKVPRVIDPEEEGLDGIRWYDVFSFIIYASREEPPNDIFSRSITIHCEKNTRPTRKLIDEERAKQLRTRWLAQRIRLHGRLKITFDEFASEDGRLQELFSPLLVMAQTFGDEEAAQAIIRYGRLVEQEIHSMEATSDDALILEAMLASINSGQNDAPEYVTVREIVERLNDGLGREAYTPAYVGRRLSALGFRRKRIHGGHVAYIVDMNLLQRLAPRYNVAMDMVLA